MLRIFTGFFLFIFSTLLFFPAYAQVQGKGTDINITTKHREIEDASAYPYSAIGTVNWAGFSSRSSCTGTLIAENLVLTAAHCITNARTDELVKPGQIHFAAGYQKGKYLAHTTVKKVYSSNKFSFHRPIDAEMIQADWAILELNEPIGRQTGYLGWAVFNQHTLKSKIVNPKGKIMVAGYPRDRIHALSTEYKCKLSMNPENDNLLRHTCQIIEGDSGGPVAIIYKDHATLIGVNSATRSNGSNFAITLAAMNDWLAVLLNDSNPIKRDQAIAFTKGSPPSTENGAVLTNAQ